MVVCREEILTNAVHTLLTGLPLLNLLIIPMIKYVHKIVHRIEILEINQKLVCKELNIRRIEP